MLLYSLTIAVTLFSSAMYYAETSEATFNPETLIWTYTDTGNLCPFSSIPASMWWCIVTMTTTGYGDNYPITPGGKVVASSAMLCGLLVLAFPLTIFGSNFQEVYEEFKAENRRKKFVKHLDSKFSNPKKLARELLTRTALFTKRMESVFEDVEALKVEHEELRVLAQKLQSIMANIRILDADANEQSDQRNIEMVNL